MAAARFIGADLTGARLRRVHANLAVFSEAILKSARFQYGSAVQADLSQVVAADAEMNQNGMPGAILEGADLTRAKLDYGEFAQANFHRANLDHASLVGANLSGADFTEANLRNVSLRGARLVSTALRRADLTGCKVYGISAWDLDLDNAKQTDLVITPEDFEKITVDNIEVAQFIYLLLNNERIRHVIDTITSKVVLILGRFTPERKVVLDALREELRKRDYLPILFDFEKPASKSLTGTVQTLAHMARFVIADLTEPSSVPHELATVVPRTIVPVQAVLLEEQRAYSMFVDLRTYHWVLEPYLYAVQDRS
jgi:hypothetical protein